MTISDGVHVEQGTIMKTLDWLYDKAINGVTGQDTAENLAESYIDKNKTIEQSARSLARWQIAKCGNSGFLTGLGGILTLPVAIPANLASVWYVQLRMIAAIAHLGGHDIRDDKVKTLCYLCLTGNAAKDVIKDMGIVIGQKMTITAIKKISGETIKKINQRVGFRLFTKMGEKGVINLGKMVPVVGGVIGAGFDATTTKVISSVAMNTFLISE